VAWSLPRPRRPTTARGGGRRGAGGGARVGAAGAGGGGAELTRKGGPRHRVAERRRRSDGPTTGRTRRISAAHDYTHAYCTSSRASVARQGSRKRVPEGLGDPSRASFPERWECRIARDNQLTGRGGHWDSSSDREQGRGGCRRSGPGTAGLHVGPAHGDPLRAGMRGWASALAAPPAAGSTPGRHWQSTRAPTRLPRANCNCLFQEAGNKSPAPSAASCWTPNRRLPRDTPSPRDPRASPSWSAGSPARCRAPPTAPVAASRLEASKGPPLALTPPAAAWPSSRGPSSPVPLNRKNT